MVFGLDHGDGLRRVGECTVHNTREKVMQSSHHARCEPKCDVLIFTFEDQRAADNNDWTF